MLWKIETKMLLTLACLTSLYMKVNLVEQPIKLWRTKPKNCFWCNGNHLAKLIGLFNCGLFNFWYIISDESQPYWIAHYTLENQTKTKIGCDGKHFPDSCNFYYKAGHISPVSLTQSTWKELETKEQSVAENH